MTLDELADHVGGMTHGEASKKLSAVASLATADSSQVAYFDNPARIKWLKHTRAGAVVLMQQYACECPTNAIIVSDPAMAMAKIQSCLQTPTISRSNIHPSAEISLSCDLGQNVKIGANALIGDDVLIGDNVEIGANCVIESCVEIGSASQVHHGVVIHKSVKLGKRVQIDSGAVIGALPFNGVKSAGIWHRGPAFGTVVVENDVHIGANTVIDRGGFSDTVLGQGAVVDNLVQIAHDTVIGPHTAVAGCAAIGANSIIGSHCIIGGASTIAANVFLADEVIITGMSTVNKSMKKPGVFSSGTMVSEHQQWRRNMVRFRQLDKWVERIKVLEKQSKTRLSQPPGVEA